MEANSSKFGHGLILSIGLICACVTTALLIQNANATANRVVQYQSSNPILVSVATLPDTLTRTVLPDEQPTWHQVKVKDGDTLAQIFDRLNIPRSQINQLLRLDKKTKRLLTRLAPGQFLALKVHGHSLQELVYKMNPLETLRIERNDQSELIVKKLEREYDRRNRYAEAKINNSLFESGQQVGISDSVTMDMAHIFGWDIDFALDIREGDTYNLLYEELYLDGKKVRDGNILAASFTTQGKTYEAIRYTDASGQSDYYTPDGRSMRKAFLRTPVDFTRISSRFGRRHHPILKKRKAHKGVDYAAPRGTPVRASGDGKIVHRGRRGGYGKTVIIQHGSSYSTLYAHLNSYVLKLGTGKRVKQGQVIGFVGSTGRATGPHLHYEFRVNGQHRDPLRVKLPQAQPISAAYKDDFMLKSKQLLALLDQQKLPKYALSTQE
ncbi:MAG: peptidoglycan DD-metalloendopeptidase family protein [Gammaproteobacteria bacterium]|nr:peptidoglycan DD-metalloendopeptidase family protein [Gammaproteobacteria bacterium]MDH5727564.1 peptidoglycan DD-metalloendopeptidase family protein [Gammaproteobacteria bacterium]